MHKLGAEKAEGDGEAILELKPAIIIRRENIVVTGEKVKCRKYKRPCTVR